MTPSPSVTIRPATKDDLPALVDLWWENSVLAESHSPTPYLRGEQECRAACHENYERSLTWANYLYVVAEYRREVVGFIIACLHAAPQKSRSGRRVVLECVFVKEPYRRRGICRQMFEQVQTFARRNQASSIEVSTECRNRIAVATYKSFGLIESKVELWKRVELTRTAPT